MRMFKTTYTYDDGTKAVQIAPYIDLRDAILDFKYPSPADRVIRCDIELDDDPDRTVRYVRDYVLDLTISHDTIIEIRDVIGGGRILASGEWYRDHILLFMEKQVFKTIIRENVVEMYIYK